MCVCEREKKKKDGERETNAAINDALAGSESVGASVGVAAADSDAASVGESNAVMLEAERDTLGDCEDVDVRKLDDVTDGEKVALIEAMLDAETVEDKVTEGDALALLPGDALTLALTLMLALTLALTLTLALMLGDCDCDSDSETVDVTEMLPLHAPRINTEPTAQLGSTCSGAHAAAPRRD